MQIDSRTARLVIMPTGGLLCSHRLGLPARLLAAPTFGLLTTAKGQVNERTEVVRVLPVERLPEQTIALGSDLADNLGLSEGASIAWELQVGGLRHVEVQELCLEVKVESQLEQVVEELNRSQDLSGQLLWKKNNQESVWLEVSGTPYRVRELSPPLSFDAVLEITPQTRITVFAAAIKAGVDIVILADSSGSMSCKDVTDSSEVVLPAGGILGLFRGSQQKTTISRIRALQDALDRLLQMRLRVSGRVSRIALVTFTDKCDNSCIRFPKTGVGMAELDANASPQLIKDFREAIGSLKPEGGTQIAPALDFAGELLRRHGREGNDKLVVLISDGASWKPKGEEATGEEIGGLDDEVSLMERLHRFSEIHLHAIGISKPEIFWRWWNTNRPGQEPLKGYVPDHALLERLVEAGGGDPSRIGDTDVLHAYFTGLGSGVTRAAKSPMPAELPPLSAGETAILNAARPRSILAANVQAEREQLADNILDSYLQINDIALKLTSELLFEDRSLFRVLQRSLRTEVFDPNTFRDFIRDAVIATFDGINERALYSMPEIAALASSAKVRDLELLGNANLPGTLNKSEQTRLDEVFVGIAGVAVIEPTDASRWAQIHIVVLRAFQDLLSKYLEAFRREEARQATAPPAAFAPLAPVAQLAQQTPPAAGAAVPAGQKSRFSLLD